MSSHNDTSSRRPIGATRSAGHSPASSPRDFTTHKLAPSTANLFAGAIAGTANGRNWPVWSGSSSAPRRNVSGSSVTSGTDLIVSSADTSFRTNLSEGWSSSRPTSATWEDASEIGSRKDHFQPDTSFSLPGSRQNSYPGTQMDNAPTGTGGKSEKYGNPLGGSEFSGPRLPSTFGTLPFPSPQHSYPMPNGAVAFPTAHNPVDNDLAMAMGGMVVSDDAARDMAPMHVPQPVVSYSGYSQADYATYYANPAALSFVPGHAAGTASQPGMYYDYTTNPGSQYYYPAQPILYPATHSPMIAPQLPKSNAASLSEKKAELQYAIQQHIAPLQGQNPVRPPGPHHRGYRASMDYGSRARGQVASGHRHGAQSMSFRRYPERPRSALLEEFRNNRVRRWDLQDVYGHIAEFSTDQHGSRFVQNKIESSSHEERQKMFDELVPEHAIRLIQDVFGNYVIQKFFEFGTPVQRALLAGTMQGHLVPLSMQMYGCRVIQKAVEFIGVDLQTQFVYEIRPQVLACVKDANGNHVIQKLVEKVPTERAGFVQSFRGHVFELATHAYGCRVLQRSLEYFPEDIARPLLDELLGCALDLMQDQFGNYVVQFVIEHGNPNDKKHIVSTLSGHMIAMSCHKFASNVCEKALIKTDPADRRRLVDEIIHSKAEGDLPIFVMMKDGYANYVLQRALEYADHDQKEAIVSRIKPHLATIRRFATTYAKHIATIERELGKVVEPYSPPGPKLV